MANSYYPGDVDPAEGGQDQWGRSPGDPNYGIPPSTDTSSSGAPGASTTNRRQQIIDGIIVPDFTRLAGRAPTQQEIDEYVDVYERFGGTAFREAVTKRFPPATAATDGGLGELSTYDGPMRPGYDFANAPQFEFSAPTGADVFADPSFTFRRDQGQRGIEASASGRGLLRTGGTLKDILGYNQNFASSEYGNIYDRKFREAQERFRPRWDEWAFNAGASKDASNREFDRRWDAWKYNNPSASEVLRAGMDA